jgi:pyruvate carboxylase
MQSGEEINIEIEPGKTLILRYLTTGDVHEDGMRTVFFELNGQPREVTVPDRSMEATIHRAAKAEADNPKHIAAPMPGKVASVAVNKGQAVQGGERLLSIEAMKMETAVYSPRPAKIGEIMVKTGSIVATGDLLIVLEG